ncbi:MAG: DUF4336 domain-containing protein [Gammaproteobacteria bacterium]|nr:DUF4336 domain-containing protein [Pseudomonadales bacterium]MCP5349221.1 DUF4336 domain-containing protein [Pseudomonadales bacterium]
MLEEFGPSLFVADGPVVSFYGFPYSTRMAIVRLAGGDLWVWSPVALNQHLVEAIEALGVVRYLVSPNKIHHLFLHAWKERWPDARLFAPPGLARRKPELHFDAQLTDEPDPAWKGEIDQVIFHGSPVMEEVVFFHRASRTAIFGDLIQRHPPAAMTGFKGALMKLDGLVGESGSTPREWRLSFLRRGAARLARDRVLAWNPQRLLIAHGECAQSNATAIIERALAWI